MKNIAVVFTHSPYGNTIGQEGLDVIISLASYTNKISVFFFGDGVFQCIKKFFIKCINFYDYSKKFKILTILGIKNFYCEKLSLKSRGLFDINNFFLKLKVIKMKVFLKKLSKFDHILNF
ncbi:MAG: sulfurtransferase complex subunit TusC [Buchnera aphidicola (Periphyllus lyropictus)]|uniref:sulfurtransferase complex subunit TusC n=1 Tax=Buchnera aphidicola TaxID=9 RepID=UPI001EC54D6A|nr:sulfurtransferase complex subunit TusC [Buchnera aphidicola]NIH16466.1 sulfurtransferase complex subunit TusC [Buchnera aphidicola (Periphyllus lyropictus)]USS94751.1 sulfurtransferase complex subunit TusC [Buchnera aphidicola (Periphyllus lyropictus)]